MIEKGANILSPEENERRIELHGQGLSDGAIGQIVGRSEQTIQRWRVSRGLPANRPKPKYKPRDEHVPVKMEKALTPAECVKMRAMLRGEW